jgi:hypothetical protein
VPPAEVALWAATGGPPLYFDAPHDGRVIAHMDLMRGMPPDIARIRISEFATGGTVWDVKPARALRVCWNGCWNLTLRSGPNPASFAAGRQKFKQPFRRLRRSRSREERRICSRFGTARGESSATDSRCSASPPRR